MPNYLQEKFELRPAPDDDESGNHGWVSDKSARTKKGLPGREGLPGGDPDSKSLNNSAFYNSLPPGMDINDQETMDTREFNSSIAGNFPRGHNAGDATQDLNARSLRMGFDKKRMRPEEDQFSREHNDAFYDTIKADDGEDAPVERNNMLDRLAVAAVLLYPLAHAAHAMLSSLST